MEEFMRGLLGVATLLVSSLLFVLKSFQAYCNIAKNSKSPILHHPDLLLTFCHLKKKLVLFYKGSRPMQQIQCAYDCDFLELRMEEFKESITILHDWPFPQASSH